MRSSALGSGTSGAEVTGISPQGVWLLVSGEELFLPFEGFPWFRDAPVSAVLRVELLNSGHLRWPDLELDLTVDSIRNPSKYPLISRP